MSYTRTLCSAAPISKVKTAYHCNETLSTWTSLATHKPNNSNPDSKTTPTTESRTRKAKPAPIKPHLDLPPTLQIGRPSPKANTTTGTHFPHRSSTPSSSPRLHLNIRSAPTTPQIDLFKPLPAIKIIPCVQRKPVTPPAPSTPSPDLLQASSFSSSPPPPTTTTQPQSVSPPTSPLTSSSSSSSSSSFSPPSPPTPSFSPLSLSPSTPSPKYGDAIFHTLPEEAYPLITISCEAKAQDGLLLEQGGEAAAIDDRERPFWRAKIQPVIDPRSGMNYYGQAVWG